jgi:hypothetical protein
MNMCSLAYACSRISPARALTNCLTLWARGQSVLVGSDLCPSTHLPATTMDSQPMYKCPCYRCTLVKRPFTRRTIQEHSKKSSAYLRELRASGGHPDLVNHVQDCHNKTSKLLRDTAEDSQSSGSPYTEGEH